MKFFIIFCICLACQLPGNAQFSESFENWIPISQTVPFVWEEPLGWSGTNSLTEFIQPSILRDSDSYDGDFAVRIQSTKIFDRYQPGILFLGNTSKNFSNLSLKPSGEAYPLDREPILLRGWYKYIAEFNEERAIVQVSIVRYNPNPEQVLVLTDINDELSPAIEYSEFQIPISMQGDFNPVTDHLRLCFYSQKQDSSHHGEAILKIDNVSLDFVNAAEEIGERGSIIVYPTPIQSGQMIQIWMDKHASSKVIPLTIYNSSGNILMENNLSSNDQVLKISTLDWKSGVYFIYQYGNLLVGKVVVY